MKSFLLIVVGFVIGGIVGVLGGGAVGTGVGAGIGIATGMQAGACLTVEAAKEKGFVTAEQIDEIFAAAAETMRTEVNVGDTTDFANSDAECQEVVARLKQAAAESQ